MPKRKFNRSAAVRRFKKTRRYIKRQSAGHPFRFSRKIPRRLPMRGFPKKQLVTMRYSGDYTVPSHDAGSGPLVFRLNSIEDPEYALGGHQPFGHDQFAAIYHKYCVIGAKVRVELLANVNTDVSGSQAYPTFFMYVDDNPHNDTRTLNQHIELGMKNKYTITNSSYDHATRFKAPSRTRTIKWSARKFFGLSKKTQMITARNIGQGDDSGVGDAGVKCGAVFGQNPQEKVAYLKMKVFDSAQATGMTARVTIDYLTIVYDVREMGQS
jgi:ribosomal protein L35